MNAFAVNNDGSFSGSCKCIECVKCMVNSMTHLKYSSLASTGFSYINVLFMNILPFKTG